MSKHLIELNEQRLTYNPETIIDIAFVVYEIAEYEVYVGMFILHVQL